MPYFASFYEIWTGEWVTGNGTKVGNNYHLNDFDEYNTITNLPNGKYKITMTAGAVQQGETEDVTGAYIYANSEQTAVTTRGNYDVICTITDGTIKAGMKTVSTSANWVSFDNLRLTYVDPYVSALATELPNDGAMTANQWYKYVVESTSEYTVTATTATDIKVTSDILLSEYTVGNAIETGEAVNLTAGTYYYKSASDNNLTITINDPIQPRKDLIIAQKGDITSLINGTFDSNTNGWTGGNHVTGLARSWRSGSVTNSFYERTTAGTMTCTLSNMPAGTYKLVAAWRSISGGTMTPAIAGTNGTTVTGVGDQQAASSEINLNGVQMPYSALGGFTTNNYGHNWQWITATGTLAADGELVLSFTTGGTAGWNAIDDVHLYCTSLDGSSYTQTVNDNTGVFNPAENIPTVDIIFSNPNKVLRTSSNYITTAAGVAMNNNQYGSTSITKLILYDGYEFSKITDKIIGNAILYRSIPADTWCTLTVPFWPTTTLTKKYPSALSGGTLTFSDVDGATWGGVDKPMLIKSASALTAIEGKMASTGGGGSGVDHNDLTSGAGAPMIGTYSTISDLSAVSGTNYVIGTDNNLHKVTGTVTLAPFRAYFNIPAGEARSFLMMNFDESTGINAVQNENSKVNGYYNLSGQRVEDPTKGLYIVNGKKIIIK